MVQLTDAKSQNTIGLPQIDNFSSNDFHGGSQTWDIKQDKWGRMYFANNEGLVIYDGSYWKIYPQPNRSNLRSISISHDTIYAGGQDELGFYAPDKNGILQYTSLKPLIPKQYNKFPDVWEIEQFNGAVFFRTWDRIFEYKDQSIQAHVAPLGWQFMKLAGNGLYAQDKKNGLYQLINNNWQPVNKLDLEPNLEVTGIVQLGMDSLLVATLQNGLFTLSKGVLTKKNTTTDDLFRKTHIYSFEQLNSTEFVAGTTSGGCLIINAAGQVIQQISRAEGLQNNNVLSIFLDNDRNLWTGLENGISFIPYNSAIKYIKPAKPNELAGYSSLVFNNKLYIATSDGAWVAPLLNTNKDLSFCKGDFSSIKNTSGQAWHLQEINNQLILGHNNGSYLIQDNGVANLIQSIGTWLYVPTSSVQPTKNIIAGTYAGLSMFEFDGNKIQTAFEIKGMYESLRFLAIDNNNEIWASHPYRGIYKITLAPDNKTYTYELYTDKNGLPSSFRNYVFRIKNKLVFATEKGIFEFDATTGQFIQSPLLYKIFGDLTIQYLAEDAEGKIWFCSGKKIGVVKFTGTNQNYTITYFPELTGKILSGFENVYPLNNENIFVASKNGIIHLNYDKYISTKPTLKLLLTLVKSTGRSDSLIFGGYFNRNRDSIYEQKSNTIQSFPANYNSFHFEFSSPSYSLQNNIQYSYQLEGYENSWSAWTSKTEKDYTNLPNGKYTFKIKAIDNLGNESVIINYSFVVRPPWYKTIWAYLLYFLLFISSVYWIAKTQKKKFELQQQKFDEEQKRLIYIYELEAEKNEKKIIQLENEKLANDVLLKNKELVDVNMHLVERNDALSKVKDELQLLYKKTGGNHDVKKAIQLVNDIEKNNSTWEQFATHFNEINNDVLKKIKLRFPNLTNTDLKVCAYLQLKLSSKEIAHLMNISVKGVELSRYRLRKKLMLTPDQSLTDFLMQIQND